jgi:hypothetical protein
MAMRFATKRKNPIRIALDCKGMLGRQLCNTYAIRNYSGAARCWHRFQSNNEWSLQSDYVVAIQLSAGHGDS